MSGNSTIRVRFGSGAGGSGSNDHLSAEVDDRPAGPNAGKTSFLPGDTAWFLVYRSAGIELSMESSAGSVTGGAEVTVTKTEDVSFEATSTATLPMPAQAVTGTIWLGRDLGALTLGADGMTLTATSSGVAVARVSYTAKALSYGLQSPSSVAGENDFDVLVLITGSRPGAETAD